MNSKIEYKLKVTLNSQTLKVLDVKKLFTSEDVLSFNTRHHDSKKFTLFTSDLGQVFYFPLANVPYNPNSNIHKVYLCDVAVGESLFVSDEYAQSLDVPSNYGSFMISSSPSKHYLTDFDVDVSTLKYVIKDRSRVQPMYEVVFEYDEEFERLSKGSFLCHKCQSQQAVTFCPAERASFCSTCDQEIHRDEFLKRHERIYFSSVGQKKFTVCQFHNNKVVEYFCNDCTEPLCTECKISGDHSTADKINHRVISFLDACHLFKNKVEEKIKPIDKAVEQCDKEICRFKDKVGSFKDNLHSARTKLEKIYKNLISELECIESSEKQIINSKYAERLCKIKQLKNIEEFSSSLDPADLLVMFKSISESVSLETQLIFDKFNVEKVHVEGNLAIVCPKEDDSKSKINNSFRDKSVRWRIETLHVDNNEVQ